MKDFILASEDWSFYGLIAQSTTDPNKSILAIRGTSNPTEWWDDLTSMALVPFGAFGNVGYGFKRIYQTLRVVHHDAAEARGAAIVPPQPSGTFAQQVAAAVERHAATMRRADEAPTQRSVTKSIDVTGHSLGGALATLYIADNFATGSLATPLICTFASPRVGDSTFVTQFDQLGITSWRIVNELDLVPKLPFLGFSHVETAQTYNSGLSVVLSPACWHSLSTYLHLIDPKQSLDAGCRRSPQAVASASFAAPASAGIAARSATLDKEVALSIPASSGATINITIKIG
jgi:hypothetical protein